MIRLQEGRKKTNEDDLREAVNRVAEKERRGEIEENSETFVVPERLMADPQPLKEGESAIASTRTHSISDVTEVVLKNGIKIALKSTNFLDDQVLMRVVARGGLSEVPKEKYKGDLQRVLLLANWAYLDTDRKFSPTPWRGKESTLFQI